LRGEGIYDHEFAAIHASIIRPDAFLPLGATWESLATAAKLPGLLLHDLRRQYS
jgi:hypothetical protein